MDCHQGHGAQAYFCCTAFPPRGPPCHRERAVLQGNLWCANTTEWQLLKTSPIPLPCRRRGITHRILVVKSCKTHIPCQCAVCQACSAFSSSFLQAVKAVISLALLSLLYPVSALPWTLVLWAKSSSQACMVEPEGGLLLVHALREKKKDRTLVRPAGTRLFLSLFFSLSFHLSHILCLSLYFWIFSQNLSAVYADMNIHSWLCKTCQSSRFGWLMA